MNLELHSAVLRAVDGGRVVRPVTVVTAALSEISERLDVRGRSRQTFGVERREVEAGLRARIEAEAAERSFGRRRTGTAEVES